MMTNIRWVNRILLFALVVGLVALAQVSVDALIGGSAHDFTGSGWTGGRICIACHTPHFADTTVAQSPLWNHEVSTEDFTGSLYTSPTLDAGPLTNPMGLSRLCLSCHDGTVALDSYGGATGGSFISAASNVNDGTNGLTNDHPISFTYNTALATTDGELHDPATSPSNVPGSTATIQADLLFGDSLECSSCHDVHNTTIAPPGDFLLRVSPNGSQLCLTCHNK